MPASLRLPLALVAALVAAEAAVLLLRPRETGPEPVPVRARAYFSEQQIEKADAFRGGQRWLFGARLLVEGGVLVLLVTRGPRVVRLARRPIVTGAAAGVLVSLATGLATLPVSVLSRERAKDVGLITQSWTGYAGDVAKTNAIGAVIAGAGGALLVFGLRRFGRHWWAPGAAVVVAFGVLTTYGAPVVLDPLFNKFEPLPDGRVRAAVLELAERANVDVGEVYSMDASRRTTAANAYVAGLGSTKRVVLFDNLLEDFSFEEVRLVVAHELAHVSNRDVPMGLLYLAIVAPFGMLGAARLAERFGADAERPARAVPAAALALALVVPTITAISNQLSRAVERRADADALALTGEPDTQIAFQKRIVVKNVGDVDPPGWYHALFGTHPTTLERIGVAEAMKR